MGLTKYLFMLYCHYMAMVTARNPSAELTGLPQGSPFCMLIFVI